MTRAVLNGVGLARIVSPSVNRPNVIGVSLRVLAYVQLPEPVGRIGERRPSLLKGEVDEEREEKRKRSPDYDVMTVENNI